jgi:hypothetical protein
MAPKKKAPPITLRRHADISRMCRRCARSIPETDFPADRGWTCQDCIDGAVMPILPLVAAGEGERYDTSMLFAGYKVVKNPKGDRAEYENEVHSPVGVFYAVAEAAFGFCTKTTRMANVLQREFPSARVQATGDDGQVRLIFPADLRLFRKVAQKVGAFKPRKVSDETKARLAATREIIAEKRAEAAQATLAL